MSNQIKLGIVGFGGRGRHLYDLAIRNFEYVKPAAICEFSDQNRELAQKIYPDSPVYAEFDEMLKKEKIDALLVETPATFHAELSVKALARNIHVLSDVPAIATIDEAQVLWEAHQNSDGIYMFGANPNTWGFVDTAVDFVEQGIIGEAYYMEAEYIHDIRDMFEVTPWRKNYESILYCTHSLGPLLRLIEEDLISVSCFDTGSHINKEDGQHDAMVALFRTASNKVIRLLVSFINNNPQSGHAYRIYGTNGYFERKPECKGVGPAQTLYYSCVEHDEKTLHELSVGEKPRDIDSDAGHGGADLAVLKRFFDAIEQSLPSPISLRDALRMSLPGIIAAESARSGGEQLSITYPWS